MATCTCCGQAIRDENEAELYSEPALADCCRNAMRIATANGSPRVEIAHFALALAASPEARAAIEAGGRDASELHQRACQYLTRLDDGDQAARSTAAPQFLEFLDRTERFAREAGHDTVSLACAIEVLATRCRDLSDTGFLRQPLPSSQPRFAAATEAGHLFGDRHDTGPAPTAPSNSKPRKPQPRRTVQAGSLTSANRHDARSPLNGREECSAQSSPTAPADPFQLRTDFNAATEQSPGAGRENRSSSAPPELAPRMTDQLSAAPTSPRGAPVAGHGIDARLRRIETALSDIAEHQSRTTRSSAQSAGVSLSKADAERLERLLRHLEIHDSPDSHDGHNSHGSSATIADRLRPINNRSRASAWRRTRQRSRTRINSSRGKRHSSARKRRDAANIGDVHLIGGRERHDQRPIHTRTTPHHVSFELDERDDEAGSDGDPDIKRFYLDLDDEIVRAPSIGPRTGERLTPYGIHRVRDLLAADASDLAEHVDVRHITAERIGDWQMQSRLVLTIPWLRGTHAQLLVGAGYTSAADIRMASRDDLCADILKFAATRDGQRILRQGPAPDVEKITKWADFAEQAELERAA